MNKLKTGVILSYVNIFLGLVISILYTPFMLRTIGENQYGLYTLVASVVSYLGLLNFGFSASYMRYYSKYKINNNYNAINSLNGMFQTIFTFISILIVVVGLLILPNLGFILGPNIAGPDLVTAKSLFFIMIFNLAIPLLFTTCNVFLIAHEEFIFIKMATLFKTVLNPILSIPILLLGYEAIGMAIAMLIITFVFELLIGLYAIKRLRIQFSIKAFDFAIIKEMAVFSSFIFINMIIDQINWNVDKFLIGRIKGTAAVAVYGVAAQINSYYMMLSTQISSVFIPRVNNLVAKKDSIEISNLFIKIGRLQYILLALVVIGFYTFGKRFVIIWAGENYVDAYYIILIIMTFVTIPLIQNIGIEIQRAKNMHKFRSIIYLLIAIVNIIISIPLIHVYGAIGASIGTALSFIVGNSFIMNWYYKKHIGLNIKAFWVNILNISKGLIVPIFTAILISTCITFENILVYLITIACFVVIYVISMFLFGMNKYEKSMVIKSINKILVGNL